MSPGAQATQAAHAAIDFCFEHREVAGEWHTSSNYLGLLSAVDEMDLILLTQLADKRGVKYTTFREPDMGDSLTAIAFEACDQARRLCSSLPLLLREKRIPTAEVSV